MNAEELAYRAHISVGNTDETIAKNLVLGTKFVMTSLRTTCGGSPVHPSVRAFSCPRMHPVFRSHG